MKADATAKADGKPNRAMREDATGAESPAGKLDGGKAPGKTAPSTSVEAQKGGVSPTLDAGGKPKGKKS